VAITRRLPSRCAFATARALTLHAEGPFAITSTSFPLADPAKAFNPLSAPSRPGPAAMRRMANMPRTRSFCAISRAALPPGWVLGEDQRSNARKVEFFSRAFLPSSKRSNRVVVKAYLPRNVSSCSTNHRYASLKPSRSEVCAFQPRLSIRELSRSLRGVPSGLDESNTSSPS